MSKVREARERQGDAATVSVDHALQLLALPRHIALAWLEEQGLITEIGGHRLVCWWAVQKALDEASRRHWRPSGPPLKRWKL